MYSQTWKEPEAYSNNQSAPQTFIGLHWGPLLANNLFPKLEWQASMANTSPSAMLTLLCMYLPPHLFYPFPKRSAGNGLVVLWKL